MKNSIKLTEKEKLAIIKLVIEVSKSDDNLTLAGKSFLNDIINELGVDSEHVKIAMNWNLLYSLDILKNSEIELKKTVCNLVNQLLSLNNTTDESVEIIYSALVSIAEFPISLFESQDDIKDVDEHQNTEDPEWTVLHINYILFYGYCVLNNILSQEKTISIRNILVKYEDNLGYDKNRIKSFYLIANKLFDSCDDKMKLFMEILNQLKFAWQSDLELSKKIHTQLLTDLLELSNKKRTKLFDTIEEFWELKNNKNELKEEKEKVSEKMKNTEIDSLFENYYRTSLASKGNEISELVKEIYKELKPLNDFVKFSSSAINLFKYSNSDKKYTHYISIGAKLPIKLYVRYFAVDNIDEKLKKVQKIINSAKLETDGQQIIIPLSNINDFKSVRSLL